MQISRLFPLLLSFVFLVACSDQTAEDTAQAQPSSSSEQRADAQTGSLDAVLASAPSYADKCLQGDAGACVEAAFESDEPQGWNEKACTLNSKIGCANVGGEYYSQGNMELTRVYLGKACDLKDDISCTNLGVIAQQNAELKQATLYFGKACLLGSGPACVSWKSSATQLCQTDFNACLDVASTYSAEKNSVNDDVFMLDIACTAGYEPACAQIK